MSHKQSPLLHSITECVTHGMLWLSCGVRGGDLKQEVGAPQAAVEAHPAGAAVVQALLQVLQSQLARPPLHLRYHVLRTAVGHSALSSTQQILTVQVRTCKLLALTMQKLYSLLHGQLNDCHAAAFACATGN